MRPSGAPSPPPLPGDVRSRAGDACQGDSSASCTSAPTAGASCARRAIADLPRSSRFSGTFRPSICERPRCSAGNTCSVRASGRRSVREGVIRRPERGGAFGSNFRTSVTPENGLGQTIKGRSSSIRRTAGVALRSFAALHAHRAISVVLRHRDRTRQHRPRHSDLIPYSSYRPIVNSASRRPRATNGPQDSPKSSLLCPDALQAESPRVRRAANRRTPHEAWRSSARSTSARIRFTSRLPTAPTQLPHCRPNVCPRLFEQVGATVIVGPSLAGKARSPCVSSKRLAVLYASTDRASHEMIRARSSAEK